MLGSDTVINNDSMQISVQVNANPQPNLGNDTAFCVGDVLTLDAGAGFNSYTWSSGGSGQTEDVTTVGIYSVTVTDIAGCAGADTINVSSNPVPVFSIGNDTSMCSTDSIVLDAGTWTSYIWNDSSTNQTLTIDSSSIADSCLWTLEMYDSFGDSWNGANIDIHIKPYFPAKSFVIELHGRKGEDEVVDWDSKYKQE